MANNEINHEEQEQRIREFSQSFISYLFDIASKESLPESLKFKGVNFVRNYGSGDSISFGIIFNRGK